MTTRDTAWPDGTPCWVDLMTTDVAAARTFYGDLFGWEFDIGPAETHDYSTANLDGKSVAGIFQMAMEHPPVWTTYLAAASADDIADAAVRAGGTIAQPTMDVMGVGRMTVLQDVTGATFASWQPGSSFGAERYNESGTLIWNELVTRDYDAAKEFYAAVFSCTYTDIGGDAFSYSTIEVDGDTVGGVGMLPAEVPAHVPAHWRVYFAVDDADEAVARAVSLGAEVRSPAADMPYGRHADLADPQGALFSVIAPTSPE